MRHPGDVWFLPPDAVEGGDAKPRRHVLLTPCEDVEDAGILAYASTRGTEAAFGAACLSIDPSLTPYGRAGRTGFSRLTYIYPSRLVGASPNEMQRLVGRLVDEMPALRLQLRKALGIGVQDARPGSWRRRIVRFSEALRREMDYSYGLIVTEPAYSSKRRYQLVVPLLDLRDFEQSGRDVVVDGEPWLAPVMGHSAPVAFAVEMVQAVFHPTDLEDATLARVDAETAARIDARLVELFDL